MYNIVVMLMCLAAAVCLALCFIYSPDRDEDHSKQFHSYFRLVSTSESRSILRSEFCGGFKITRRTIQLKSIAIKKK